MILSLSAGIHDVDDVHDAHDDRGRRKVPRQAEAQRHYSLGRPWEEYDGSRDHPRGMAEVEGGHELRDPDRWDAGLAVRDDVSGSQV